MSPLSNLLQRVSRYTSSIQYRSNASMILWPEKFSSTTYCYPNLTFRNTERRLHWHHKPKLCAGTIRFGIFLDATKPTVVTRDGIEAPVGTQTSWTSSKNYLKVSQHKSVEKGHDSLVVRSDVLLIARPFSVIPRFFCWTRCKQLHFDKW
ncbi:hypothetical protein BDN72DRAFT_402998 [Pluteus cervinus]|uniref:Uncharacterized protein n=1 Tax=Pluteus cervinus TaxID=181527 RepID=A0ACD3B260_9AGAR|nr:hypothetical protein BDN72DRAFT_402998 [Pluteus cervinus]